MEDGSVKNPHDAKSLFNSLDRGGKEGRDLLLLIELLAGKKEDYKNVNVIRVRGKESDRFILTIIVG